MTTTTMTALATEHMIYPSSDNTGAGGSLGDTIAYRPAGIYLQNDGKVYYWLMNGYTYQLEHDGTGWQVLLDGRPYGAHAHRLAHGGELVDWLPGANGSQVDLDPVLRYEIRMSEPAAVLVEL